MKVATSDNKNGKKIIMKAVILQPILMSCFEGVTISNLCSTISRVISIDKDSIKKYLFYMIEFNLITYQGKIKSFFIANDGIELLLQIESMKSRENLNTNQIFLQINEFK
ncbi:MAG: hypothetical protein DA329_06890 [Candidatus Nitrosocosmicus sp.]|jgi:hypothetical protein|nr:hypothetical protein [Candidatus Nitrosocosmicus sp.]